MLRLFCVGLGIIILILNALVVEHSLVHRGFRSCWQRHAVVGVYYGVAVGNLSIENQCVHSRMSSKAIYSGCVTDLVDVGDATELVPDRGQTVLERIELGADNVIQLPGLDEFACLIVLGKQLLVSKDNHVEEGLAQGVERAVRVKGRVGADTRELVDVGVDPDDDECQGGRARGDVHVLGAGQKRSCTEQNGEWIV